ncbi:MAG: hypothetical protein JSU68_04280 [Phycisphaerales bacterium]|nr:MAG: hypothetical protein JSU68_04280 [Phycisphaerales bacterium]
MEPSSEMLMAEPAHLQIAPAPAHAAGHGRTQWALRGVGWRVEQHDRSRIELKLQYALPPGRRKAHYRVDLFFFVPPNLGINPRHYDRDDFYEDLQTYTRYGAPVLPLGSLADFDAPAHPLAPLLGWMKAGAPLDGQAGVGKLVHALKLYAAATVESLDEERKFLSDQSLHVGPPDRPRLSSAETLQRARLFTDGVQNNLAAFRRLRARLLHPKLDTRVATALVAIDEYLSLEAEEALFKIIALLDRLKVDGDELSAHARALIRAELDYRSELGLPSRVSPDADEASNEAYQYRRGVLKKFTASALFLNLQGSRARSRVGDIIAAVAAGLAMAFALTVAVVSTRYTSWSIYSMQWIVVAVIAYMFKDRIKEWARRLGSTQLSRWLSDHRGILREEGVRGRVGTVCETHRYVRMDQLERGIRNIRMADPFSRLEQEHAPEWVMCYAREIRLRGRRVEVPLTDILRYDFDRYTKRMDDPKHPVPVLMPDDKIRTVMTPRIYRVNLALRITDLTQGADSTVHAFARVILTSKGIRRVELAG